MIRHQLLDAFGWESPLNQPIRGAPKLQAQSDGAQSLLQSPVYFPLEPQNGPWTVHFCVTRLVEPGRYGVRSPPTTRRPDHLATSTP